MITLHHLRVGRSIFAVWLLEEVGAPYELKIYHRDRKTFRAGDDLKEIHPLGKSPVIEEDGLILAESGAITSYVLHRYDPEHRFSPRPSDLAEWARYMQWLHYPEGSAVAPLLLRMLLVNGREPHTLIDRFSAKEIDLHLDYIRDQLGDNRFILGDQLSGADFGLSYTIWMAQSLGLTDEYPTLVNYLAQNQNRPAFHRAIERAGK